MRGRRQNRRGTGRERKLTEIRRQREKKGRQEMEDTKKRHRSKMETTE